MGTDWVQLSLNKEGPFDLDFQLVSAQGLSWHHEFLFLLFYPMTINLGCTFKHRVPTNDGLWWARQENVSSHGFDRFEFGPIFSFSLEIEIGIETKKRSAHKKSGMTLTNSLATESVCAFMCVCVNVWEGERERERERVREIRRERVLSGWRLNHWAVKPQRPLHSHQV